MLVAFRRPRRAGGCASNGTEFSYDESVPLPTPPASAAEERPRPLHAASSTVAHGERRQAHQPVVENANAAAQIEPRREGYYNAIQIILGRKEPLSGLCCAGSDHQHHSSRASV